MASIGGSPFITLSTINTSPRPGNAPHGRRLGIKSMGTQSGDRLERHNVRFGSQQLQDPLFADLIKKGYHPSVLASEKDIPGVVDCIETAFGNLANNMTKPQYIEAFKENFDRGAYTYVIRPKDSQKVIGTATLTTDGYIFSVGVDPEHQRKGIARTMMKGLIAEAKRQKMPDLNLNTNNRAAVQLYESLGFKKTGQKTKDGMDIMMLKLESQPKGSLLKRAFKGILSSIGWVCSRLFDLLKWLFSSAAPVSR